MSVNSSFIMRMDLNAQKGIASLRFLSQFVHAALKTIS